MFLGAVVRNNGVSGQESGLYPGKFSAFVSIGIILIIKILAEIRGPCISSQALEPKAMRILHLP